MRDGRSWRGSWNRIITLPEVQADLSASEDRESWTLAQEFLVCPNTARILIGWSSEEFPVPEFYSRQVILRDTRTFFAGERASCFFMMIGPKPPTFHVLSLDKRQIEVRLGKQVRTNQKPTPHGYHY